MRRSLDSWFAALVGMAFLQLPATASACSVCMGDPNSKTAGAINAAIFLMLAFIMGVLGLLGALGVSLMRRANSPLPPHMQVADGQFPADDSEEN